MPRFIYNAAATLNGFLADENDSLAWLFAVETAGAPDMDGFLSGVGVLVEGSTTYEWVLREENLLAEPATWQGLYGSRPTYVFSTRALPIPDGADVRLVARAVPDVLAEIRVAAGEKDVWILGGGDLAGQFLDAEALDEIVVSVAPALVTGGAPLLPRAVDPDRLRLRDVSRYGQFAQLTYDVSKAPSHRIQGASPIPEGQET